MVSNNCYTLCKLWRNEGGIHIYRNEGGYIYSMEFIQPNATDDILNCLQTHLFAMSDRHVQSYLKGDISTIWIHIFILTYIQIDTYILTYIQPVYPGRHPSSIAETLYPDTCTEARRT